MRYSAFVIFILSAVVIASCGKLDYKKSPGGLVYKIISDGKGDSVRTGDYIKFNIENKVNDSVYSTTFGKDPAYVQASAFGNKYDISELWTKMRIGDSVIVFQSLDTFLKRGAQLPPEIKKGDMLIVTIKILDIFKTDSAANADREKASLVNLPAEKEAVKKFMSENKIEGYQETPSGAFVKIIEPGTGNIIDSGNYISVRYRGSLFNGAVFDGNMDADTYSKGPFSFTVNVDRMAKGFTEGVRMLRKGSVAKIYIPASLAYGSGGNPPSIGPNENIMFDIKIEDVKDKAPEPVPVPSNITDSLRKKMEPKKKQ
jgi:FKBP-type peptidyl-prolyl cis-trans isomerase FkpA